MGRKYTGVHRTTLAIPADLFDQLSFYLMNPVTGKTRYGSLSILTTNLWRGFIRQMEQPGVDPVATLKLYGIDITDPDPDDPDNAGDASDPTPDLDNQEPHND